MALTASSATVSVARRFLRSTAAGYSSLFVRVLVTLGARMALARLLLPAEHGTYDLALHVVVVAAALRDLGLPYQLTRDPGRPYGTVLVFGLVSSVAMTLFLVLGAPLATSWAPELPSVLRVYALWVFLDGLVVVPRTFFERQLEVGRLAIPEIARGIVVAVVSVAMAAMGQGVSSLIVGDLVGAALFAAWVWKRAWGRVPIVVDLSLLPELLRRSRALFLVWVAYYLATYADVFIIRRFGDAASVGVYGRAYFLAFLARQILFPRSLLPALVAYRDEPMRFADTARLATVYLLFFQVTSGLFLFFNASEVIALYLGPQWGGSVPLLRVLCLVPFLDVFTEIGGELLRARFEDRLWLAVTLLNLVSLLACGILLTSRWGPLGMAWANFCLLGHFVMAWRLMKLFVGRFLSFVADLLWVYLVPLAFFGLAAALAPPGGWRLAASVAAGLLSAAALVPRFRPLFVRFLSEPAVSGGVETMQRAEGSLETHPGRQDELL